MNSHGPDPKAERILGGVATDQRHDSAHKHVTGSAAYIDDMPEPAGTLHACLGLSTVAHGTILSLDLTAVRAAPGVVDVIVAADIPGDNDVSPTGRSDEPLLASTRSSSTASQFSRSSRRPATRRAAPAGWLLSNTRRCR